MPKKDALREAKSNLYSEGLLWRGPILDAVPSPIERSWRRAVSQGVSPSATAAGGAEDLDRDERLGVAARPVMARLADDLAGMSVAVVLSDAEGHIIERVIHERSMRARLDGAGAVVGADYSEPAIGTNGLGTVLEDRSPLLVCGAEHFVESLEEMACSGVPIIDPGTRRVRGSLSLACMASQANPLMLTLTHAAVREIEQRLLDGADQGLHDLASAFATATRAHRGALAVLTPSTVLANTAGLAYVAPADHAVIWDRLVAERLDQPSLLRVELTSGAVDLRAQRLHVTDEELAFQIGISPVRGRRPRTASHDRAPLHPLPRVDRELNTLASANPVIAVAGDSGTGKTYAARGLLAKGPTSFDEMDPSANRDPWPASWSGSIRFALAAGGSVLLRHVETIPANQHAVLRTVLGVAAEEGGLGDTARLVLTVDESAADPELLRLLSQHASMITLPALSAMRSVIPSIVKMIIDQCPERERCTVAPAAMQTLMRYDWPGNVAELRRVVADLLAKRAGAVIRESDLPDAVTGAAAGRALGGLERSERAAILSALRESDGNRAEAARILGIGRTTLYRKLRVLRIDQDGLST